MLFRSDDPTRGGSKVASCCCRHGPSIVNNVVEIDVDSLEEEDAAVGALVAGEGREASD